MIHGIHHIAIGVPDFERGLEFYCDQLGFEVVQQADLRDFELAAAGMEFVGEPVDFGGSSAI